MLPNKKLKIRFFFFSTILVSFFILFESQCFARSLRTFLQVEILLSTDNLLEGEALAGEVVIRNIASRSMPAVFNVEVYNKDVLEHKAVTSIPKIFTGTNKYDVNVFALNQIKYYPGQWKVMIYQSHTHYAPSAEATFTVKHN